jgi:hypothetical protein
MRRSMVKTAGIGLALLLVPTSASAANDRLPQRLRKGYSVAQAEVKRYLRYILGKVWTEPLGKLRRGRPTLRRLRDRAEATVDEIVHLTLPQAKRILGDAVFGTGATHLRLTRPELREQARRAAVAGLSDPSPARSVAEAVERMGGVAERRLNDRLEQALLEDMEDFVQQRVEGALGLPVQGRGRAYVRRLPDKWESVYQKEARLEVHRYLYWWLRKRQRLALGHLSMSMSREALDRARHQGPVWRLLSGISDEAWAQNRLRIDFKWGHLNWEIDRRRLRRRMDQDLAQGTWAMARLVKELSSPRTQAEATKELERQVEQALDGPAQRKEAERYPDTALQLRRDLQPLKETLDPLFNRAMERVELPADMPPELQELAREHARRFMREEMETSLAAAIRRGAVARSAGARVRERLGAWVGEALRRFDPGAGAPRLATKDFVRKETLPRVREKVDDALRAAGIDEFTVGRERQQRAIERVMRHNRFERAIDEAVDRELEQARP